MESQQHLPTSFQRIPISNWSSRNVDQCYYKICEVGHGTYGCVYKAQSLDESKNIVALKEMQYMSSKHEEGFPITTLRQIKLLQNLNHENILKIKEVLHKRVKGEFPIVNICLDYMDYDLDLLVKEKNYSLDVPRIRYVMREILKGIEYLHKNYVIHRDIKSKNILVDKAGHVKVADFGLAKVFKNKKYLTVKVVTLWYRAPEILLGNRAYDSKIDVWSAGCILAELLLRKPLFQEQITERDIIKKIFELVGTPETNGWQDQVKDLQIYKQMRMSMPIQSTLVFQIKKRRPDIEHQSQLLNLLEKMLELNPHRRLSAAEALQHEFFTQHEPMNPHEVVPKQIQEHLAQRQAHYKGQHVQKKIKVN